MPILLLPLLGSIVLTAGFAAVFSTVLSIGISYALGSIARALRKSPTKPSLSQDAVSRTVNVREAIAARRVIYGYLGRIGGVVTFANLAGVNNEWLDLIITIAGHECDTIGPTMNFDDQTFTINPATIGGGIAHNVVGKFNGVCFVEINPGTANPAEFGILRTDVPALWTVNHRQRGCAGVHLRLIWNADKFANGTPTATFDVKGRKVYDPRTTLTAWSDNPALCLRDFVTNTDFGLGAPASEIDDALVIAAANVCDELVALAAGGTEKRYTCNGSFQMSEEPGHIIESMLSAMAGDMVYIGGKWKMYAGAYRPPTVAALTDDDFRNNIQTSTKVSRRDLFNSIKGTFVSPSNKWQPSDFPAVARAKFIAEDNGFATPLQEKGTWAAAVGFIVGDCVLDANLAYVCILGHTSSAAGGAGNEPGIGASWQTYWVLASERIWKDIDLPFTTSATMAQRLARIELEGNRRQITLALPCKLKAYKVQCPDVVPITRSRFGWTNKTFQVLESTFTMDQGQSKEPVIGVDLSVRETDSAIFDWATADERAESIATGILFPDISTVAAPTALALASGAANVQTRSDGTRLPRIHVSWTMPADGYVQSGGKIMIEYRKNGAGSWIGLKPVDGAKTDAFIEGLDDGVGYDVQVWAENAAGTKSAVTSVTNHTVTGTASSGKSFGKNLLGNPGFEINASAAALNSYQTAAATPLIDEWEVGSSIGSFFEAAIEDGAATQHEGARNIVVRLKQSVTVPNDSVTYELRATCSPKIPVTSGQILLLACWAKWDKDTNLPASVTGTQRLGIKFFDASGSLVSEVSQDTSAPSATYARRAKLVQVPATSAYCKIECVGRIVNASGSSLATSTAHYMDLRFDDLILSLAGETWELAAVNASGQPRTANYLSSVAGNTTINVAATTWDYGFGNFGLNAGSVNPGAFGTYYVYYDDPTFAGGAVTYLASTLNYAPAQAEGRIYLGKITTSAGAGGGGGGGNCVEEGVPVEYPVGSVVTEELMPQEEWISVWIPGQEPVLMDPETLVAVWKKASELRAGDRVDVGDCGEWEELQWAEPVQKSSRKVKRTVEPSHQYRARRIRVHNIKAGPP